MQFASQINPTPLLDTASLFGMILGAFNYLVKHCRFEVLVVCLRICCIIKTHNSRLKTQQIGGKPYLGYLVLVGSASLVGSLPVPGERKRRGGGVQRLRFRFRI